MSIAKKRIQRPSAGSSKSLLKGIQIGFVLSVAVFVALGLWNATQGRAKAIPETVGTYGLLRTVTGSRALDMVGRIHQGTPYLTAAWIAYYEGEGVIWVGTAPSLSEARAQLEAMAEAIGKGGTPFFGLREVELVGRRAYTVNDGSQEHYFFQNGNQVIWVTSPRGSGSKFAEAVLKQL